jgi:hypothetical protein
MMGTAAMVAVRAIKPIPRGAIGHLIASKQCRNPPPTRRQ